MKITVRKLQIALTYGYVFCLATYGFFRAFFSISIMTDIVGILLLFVSIFNGHGSIFFTKKTRLITAFCVLFCVGCGVISIISAHSLRLSILSFRCYVLYIAFGFSTINMKSIEAYKDMLNVIVKIGTIICGFAVIQYFFYESLPVALRHYPGAAYEGVFGLASTVLFRVNGMLENTIVFGNYAAIIAAISFARWMVDGYSRNNLISLTLICVSIILTFGRVAIVGTVVEIVFIYLLCNKKRIANKMVKLIICVLLGISFVLFFFGDSALVMRLLGQGDGTAISNMGHFNMKRKALEVIKENWLLGIGMGTQGYVRGNLSAVITDGGWLSWCLEMGIPVTLLHILAMFSVLIYAFKVVCTTTNDVQKMISGSLFAITLLFLCANVLNSAYSALANYGTYWLMVGLLVGATRLLKVENKK